MKPSTSLIVPVPDLKTGPFGNVQFTFCNVTPELAATWLKRNVKNRRIKPNTVRGYVTDMLNGAWMTTHQGIAFDSAGNLLDGQHRLMAIVKSKVSVILLVSTGWPVAMDPKHMTMDAVDRGLARSLADQLHLQHGIDHKEAHDLVRICNAIVAFCVGAARVPKSTTDSILAVFALYKKEIKWLLSSPVKSHGFSVAHSFAAAAMARAVFDEEKLDDFLNRLLTGENLTRDNAILPLRNWLLAAANKELRKESTRFIVFHHILAFVEGRPCASLVTHSDLAYKRVIELSRPRVQKIRDLYAGISEEFGEATRLGHERAKAAAAAPAPDVSAHDLPAGSMIRKVYFEALKAPQSFTAESLSVALGNSIDATGIALVQLERKGYVTSSKVDDEKSIKSKSDRPGANRFDWSDCWLELTRLRNSIRCLYVRMRDLSPASAATAEKAMRVAKIACAFAADVVGVPEKTVIGRRGRADVVWARHIAMAVTRQVTGESYEYIKRAFKARDHTMVSYGCERVAETVEPKYREQYERVLELTRKAVGQLEPICRNGSPRPQAADKEAVLRAGDSTVLISSSAWRRHKKSAAQRRRRAIEREWVDKNGSEI